MSPKPIAYALRWPTFLISVVFFTASLTQYAYCTEGPKEECTQAVSAFLIGWIGIFAGSTATFAWLANIFLFISWVLIFNASRAIFYISSIMLLVMLLFLSANQIMVNEAGGYSKIIKYGAGYWLWVFSAVVVVISSGISSLNLARIKQ